MSQDPSETTEPTNLPAQIETALATLPAGVAPGAIKGLSRLIGAAFEIPTAWLNQKSDGIKARTASKILVEASIAQAAATAAGEDPDITHRAMGTLVGTAYRKQENREAVAVATVKELNENEDAAISDNTSSAPSAQPDDDWLNIFERYAEDASSERLQGLWGKVLAGEVRQPGKFSARTLRFLSEFSQADALAFEIFTKSAFLNFAPQKLVKPSQSTNIGHLINLETNGLIQGSTGIGLQKPLAFDENGHCFIPEGNTILILKGEPNSKFLLEVLAITPLGQELLCLVGNRNIREAAKAVAFAIRSPQIHEAYLGKHANGRILSSKILWQKENSEDQTVEGTAR